MPCAGNAVGGPARSCAPRVFPTAQAPASSPPSLDLNAQQQANKVRYTCSERRGARRGGSTFGRRGEERRGTQRVGYPHIGAAQHKRLDDTVVAVEGGVVYGGAAILHGATRGVETVAWSVVVHKVVHRALDSRQVLFQSLPSGLRHPLLQLVALGCEFATCLRFGRDALRQQLRYLDRSSLCDDDRSALKRTGWSK